MQFDMYASVFHLNAQPVFFLVALVFVTVVMLFYDLLRSGKINSFNERTVVDVTNLYSTDFLLRESKITRDELVNLFERGFLGMFEKSILNVFVIFP